MPRSRNCSILRRRSSSKREYLEAISASEERCGFSDVWFNFVLPTTETGVCQWNQSYRRATPVQSSEETSLIASCIVETCITGFRIIVVIELAGYVAFERYFARNIPELKHTERNRRRARRGLRPTSSRTRSAIISMLGPGGAVGMVALDLYAGTGAVGFDLLEHGAVHVDFVEIDRRRAVKINDEIAVRGLASKASTYRTDAIRALPQLTGNSYDLVFADPPYELDPWEEIIAQLLRHELLKPDAWIIAEHGSRSPLPDEISGASAINRKIYGDSSITIYAFPDSKETKSQP